METIENIINILLIPILPSLAVLLGLLIQKLIQKAKADLEIANGSQVSLRIDEATQAVMDAIQYTMQTYTEYMKDQGTFDKDAQKEALLISINKAKFFMSEAAQKTVIEVSGDLNGWIRTMIEAKIKELKEPQALPSIVVEEIHSGSVKPDLIVDGHKDQK